MKKINKKLFINILSMIVMFLPMVALAKLAPDCGTFSSGVITKECGLGDFLGMINTIINYLLFKISTPLAALIITYAGILYIFDGGSSKRIEQAKSILKNVVLGYLIALSAWLIVKAVLLGLGYKGEINYLSF